MIDLVSMNYLVVFDNDEMVLMTDTFTGGHAPIAYTYIPLDGSHYPPTYITLTDQMNFLQHARNHQQNRMYVFEEWS